jgi:hypothetical protein
MTGKTSLREVLVTGPTDARLVAVRAVELLRASLLEVGAAHPSRGDVAPADEARALAEAADPPVRWLVGLHGGASLTPGALGASGYVGASATFRPHDYLGLRVFVATQPVSASIAAPEGSATSVTSVGSMGGRAFVAAPESRWNFYGGPAIGLSWMHLEGSAVPPYQGTTDDVVVPTLFLDSGIFFAITPRVRISLDADLLIALAPARVLFAGREVASWGRPSALVGGGVEVGLD